MAEYNFPTETIDLPSGGKFYSEGSPLRSGKVDVKYMTAKEEDILTSTNLIQKGVVIDKLMNIPPFLTIVLVQNPLMNYLSAVLLKKRPPLALLHDLHMLCRLSGLHMSPSLTLGMM